MYPWAEQTLPINSRVHPIHYNWHTREHSRWFHRSCQWTRLRDDCLINKYICWVILGGRIVQPFMPRLLPLEQTLGCARTRPFKCSTGKGSLKWVIQRGWSEMRTWCIETCKVCWWKSLLAILRLCNRMFFLSRAHQIVGPMNMYGLGPNIQHRSTACSWWTHGTSGNLQHLDWIL